jgi:hypothetical protein
MLIIYGHKLTKQDLQTIIRMMKAVGIEDFKTIDLMSQPQEDGPGSSLQERFPILWDLSLTSINLLGS